VNRIIKLGFAGEVSRGKNEEPRQHETARVRSTLRRKDARRQERDGSGNSEGGQVSIQGQSQSLNRLFIETPMRAGWLKENGWEKRKRTGEGDVAKHLCLSKRR